MVTPKFSAVLNRNNFTLRSIATTHIDPPEDNISLDVVGAVPFTLIGPYMSKLLATIANNNLAPTMQTSAPVHVGSGNVQKLTFPNVLVPTDAGTLAEAGAVFEANGEDTDFISATLSVVGLDVIGFDFLPEGAVISVDLPSKIEVNVIADIFPE